MTIKELKEHCVRLIAEFERIKEIMPVTPNGYKRYEEHKIVLQLIEAWENVKNDIKGISENPDYKPIGTYDYVKGSEDCREVVLEIIDKHLANWRQGNDEV